MELTDSIVAELTLPAGKREHFEWDSASPLAVRLRGDGVKRYIVQYRFGPKQRRETLGDPARMKLATARKIARQRLAQVELGTDPTEERARSHAEAAAVKLTVGATVKRYLAAKHALLRPASYVEATRYLERYFTSLHVLHIGSVTRTHVAAALQDIAAERGRTTARNARRP
jgi:bifunctional DNA-binding transcriptional regulator/antitoxin component of YhaV-PrlF toxin-antitoxin module